MVKKNNILFDAAQNVDIHVVSLLLFSFPEFLHQCKKGVVDELKDTLNK